MHHTPKKVTCIGCISITKVASHLQRMIFRLQKLRFAYKYLIVRLQNCISGYKTASRFAIEFFFSKKHIKENIFDKKHQNLTKRLKKGSKIVNIKYI